MAATERFSTAVLVMDLTQAIKFNNLLTDYFNKGYTVLSSGMDDMNLYAILQKDHRGF